MLQQCRKHLGKVVSHAEQSKLHRVSSMFFFSKKTIKLRSSAVIRGNLQTKGNMDIES